MKSITDEALEKLYYSWNGNYNSMQLQDKRNFRIPLRWGYQNRYWGEQCIKELGKLDLFFFSKGILGYNLLEEQPHRRFCEEVEDPNPKKILQMPRDFFKTTIATKSHSLQLLLNDPELRILLANATATNAEKFLFEIEKQIESNSLLRQLYPEIVPPNTKKIRWSSQAMDIPRKGAFSEASIETIGVGGTVTSRHYDVFKKDDLVDEDQLTSREQMEKVIEWDKYSISLAIDPDKYIDHIVGTRWAYYDYISYCLENLPHYKSFKLRAIDDMGNPTFPKRFPLRVLAEIKARQGPYIFSTQYLNSPLPGETQDFREGWIQWYETERDIPSEVKERWEIWYFMDPAMGETANSCYSALVIVGFDHKTAEWWILDTIYGIMPPKAEKGQKDQRNLITEIFNTVEKRYPYTFVYETYAAQKLWKYLLETEMDNRGVHFHLQECPTERNKSKFDRIRKLVAPMSSGRVHMKKSMTELRNEIVGFPLSQRIDVLDALSFGTYFFDTPSMEQTTKKETINPFSLEAILQELNEQTTGELPFPEQLGKERTFLG